MICNRITLQICSKCGYGTRRSGHINCGVPHILDDSGIACRIHDHVCVWVTGLYLRSSHAFGHKRAWPILYHACDHPRRRSVNSHASYLRVVHSQARVVNPCAWFRPSHARALYSQRSMRMSCSLVSDYIYERRVRTQRGADTPLITWTLPALWKGRGSAFTDDT